MRTVNSFLTQSCRPASKVVGESVCVVIVTYHPSVGLLKSFEMVLSEVQGCVVVDNGSSDHERGSLKNASQNAGFHLIEIGENVGIAEALNQGVCWAKDKGYSWVLLFDQDSQPEASFLEKMFKTWSNHPRRNDIASIHPLYMHPALGFERYAPRAPDGSPVWSMTSGALMPTWIFDKIGWFASEFFIDWVDIEYCFRLRAAGYLIAESAEAILLHAPGQPAPSSILGYRFWASHHSAARRYYMSRNRVVVFRKYFLRLPLFTLKAMYAALRDTTKCFLGERERPRKFRNLLLGTWDGLTGRMGRREGL